MIQFLLEVFKKNINEDAVVWRGETFKYNWIYQRIEFWRNKLEKEKVIEKYTAKLDYEKIGYDVEVMIELRISKGRLFEVEKKIAAHPNVFAIYDVTGAYDAVILARFPTRRQMDNFLKKIQTYEFVERTETKLILNTIKEENIGV